MHEVARLPLSVSPTSGKEVMQLLLEKKGDKVKITPEVVEAIIRSFDWGIMQLLLE